MIMLVVFARSLQICNVRAPRAVRKNSTQEKNWKVTHNWPDSGKISDKAQIRRKKFGTTEKQAKARAGKMSD
ncbi:MAG TPA: hypothetical protein H9707_00705 [Candidatus Butyricicoccus avicola]|nr:hypothetical protein [Candidatus Butyricicoccus avicola]